MAARQNYGAKIQKEAHHGKTQKEDEGETQDEGSQEEVTSSLIYLRIKMETARLTSRGFLLYS